VSTADQTPAPSTGAAAEVLPDEDAQLRSDAAAYSAQRRAERRTASWQSMVLSLAVVVGIVFVLLLLVPRVNSITQPPLDVGLGVRAASGQLAFPPSVPTGLPDGWRATSVRTARSTAGVLMWHVGYQTPSQQYAAVQQGKDAPEEWVRAQTNRAPVVGTQSVAGAQWTRYARQDKLQNSLVLARRGLTTVVTGTAGFVELGRLAASLRPAP
jgi:uncharacterized protein DUF4245